MNQLSIGGHLSTETLFRIHLVLGYVAWLLCFGTYIWPRLKSMDRPRSATRHRYAAQLPILWAGFQSFPASSAPNLPTEFAVFAAYGDFATGVLAMLALLTGRIRPAVFGRWLSPTISSG